MELFNNIFQTWRFKKLATLCSVLSTSTKLWSPSLLRIPIIEFN